MSFGEIFRKSFLEGYEPADITTLYVVITLAITCAIATYIFLIYRLTAKKVFYSLSFNISLVATALITATIIFTIQSSVVISLGMVGALSIVRFRTAIKDPLDLVYLFWSISVGIVCGAGYAEYAVILSVLITAVLLILSKVKEIAHPQILVVNAKSSDIEKALVDYLNSNTKKYKIKSRNSSQSSFNVVVELSVPENNTVITDLEKLEGVFSVSLVSHDGEVTY